MFYIVCDYSAINYFQERIYMLVYVCIYRMRGAPESPRKFWEAMEPV